MQNALISVSDKTGIVEFAKELVNLGFRLISTGGTESVLKASGLDVVNVSEITHFPECLNGRVKTLHPAVHAGILARRNLKDHMNQIQDLGIETIDLVVINLYPFAETIQKPKVSFEEAIENIDIGGPTMLRSAAKNHEDVLVVVNPEDYSGVLNALKEKSVTHVFRRELALKVFEHTAFYDALISDYLRKQVDGDVFPQKMTLAYEKVQDMRYGENPHQRGAFYREVSSKNIRGLADAKQLHGKELSFNNINDANAALGLLKEFEKPTAVAVKHATPCGVGVGIDIFHAFEKANACDPVSIFGGVVALNRPVDLETAEKLGSIFLEIIIAPDFEADALEHLMRKKNVRILKFDIADTQSQNQIVDLKKVTGGILIQDQDSKLMAEDMKVMTERIPTKQEMEEMTFAWTVCKHVKSNGIVISKNGMTLGLGQGQVSRVWASEAAVGHSNFPTKGSVLASDAFFPFADAVELAAKAGVTAIIQPGGSVRDAEIIEVANQYGIAMVFTGMRHFKH